MLDLGRIHGHKLSKYAPEGLRDRTPTRRPTVAERLAEQASLGKPITFDDVMMSPANDGEEVHGGWDVLATRPTPRSNDSNDSITPRVRSAFSGITLSCEMSTAKSTETALIKVAPQESCNVPQKTASHRCAVSMFSSPPSLVRRWRSTVSLAKTLASLHSTSERATTNSPPFLSS